MSTLPVQLQRILLLQMARPSRKCCRFDTLLVAQERCWGIRYISTRVYIYICTSALADMQLQSAADGHGVHEMSVWSASSSNVADKNVSYSIDRFKRWWPSQAYHCTFCPRVFRTAQALGGHMNIHRRERATANDVDMDHHNIATPRLTLLSEPGGSHSPADHSSGPDPGRRPLFSATHRLLLLRNTPPAGPFPTGAAPSYMDHPNRSTRLPCSNFTLPAPRLQISPNLPRLPPGSVLQRPHVVVVGGAAPHNMANMTTSSSLMMNSDPLTWLFSQLPPPGSFLPLHQPHLVCRSHFGPNANIDPRFKPYHRSLPPGARRHVCRMSPLAAHKVLYTGMHPGRGSRVGMLSAPPYGERYSFISTPPAHRSLAPPEAETLDLELRL